MDQKTISKLLLREQKQINFPYYDLVTKHHKTLIRALGDISWAVKGKLNCRELLNNVQSPGCSLSLAECVCVFVFGHQGDEPETGCLVLPH